MEKYMFLFVGGDASHLSNEALAHRELTAQEACLLKEKIERVGEK